jgi:hypothetical protein
MIDIDGMRDELLRYSELSGKLPYDLVIFSAKALRLMGLDVEDEAIWKRLKGARTKEICRDRIIKQVLSQDTLDYTSFWISVITKHAHECIMRYDGPRRSSSVREYAKGRQALRQLAKCYLYAFVQADIIKGGNLHGLDDYLCSQLSHIYGLRTKYPPPISVLFSGFWTRHSEDRYRHFVVLGRPPFMSSAKLIDKLLLALDEVKVKKLLRMEDSKCLEYLEFAYPILRGKIPDLINLSTSSLRDYVSTLSYLIARERRLRRTYEAFLLSLEAARAIREIGSRGITWTQTGCQS